METQADSIFETDRYGVVLEAGFRVFQQYGYKQSTMDHIAEAAGMSRPAVYQYYRGKKAVFEALAIHLQEKAITQVEAVCQKADLQLQEQIRACFEARDVWLWEVLMTSGHGMELISSVKPLSGDINQQYRDKFRDILFRQVSAAEAEGEIQFQGKSLDAGLWVDLLIQAIRGGEMKMQGPAWLRQNIQQVLHLFFQAVSVGT